MEFTKDELVEIEKMFDDKAGGVIFSCTHFLKSFEKYVGEKKDELAGKVIHDSVQSYDVFRSISTKARMIRDTIDKRDTSCTLSGD